jgi:hypothetical protein
MSLKITAKFSDSDGEEFDNIKDLITAVEWRNVAQRLKKMRSHDLYRILADVPYSDRTAFDVLRKLFGDEVLKKLNKEMS